MANYELTYEKSKEGGHHLYIYDKDVLQKVGLNTLIGIVHKDEKGETKVRPILNCTRARYVGKGIFMYFKNPSLIGLINIKKNSKKEINLSKEVSKIIMNSIESSENEDAKLNELLNKVKSDSDFVLENSRIEDDYLIFSYSLKKENGNDILISYKTLLNSVKGIKGLNVSLSYLMSKTPVLHSDLQDDRIWKIGRITF